MAQELREEMLERSKRILERSQEIELAAWRRIQATKALMAERRRNHAGGDGAVGSANRLIPSS